MNETELRKLEEEWAELTTKLAAAWQANAKLGEGSRMGGRAFHDGFLRNFPVNALEVVPVRVSPEGEFQIFMIWREDPNTPEYHHKWHTPGSIQRPFETFREPLARAITEIGSRVEKEHIVDLPASCHDSPRGIELAIPSIVMLTSRPTREKSHWKWFSLAEVEQMYASNQLIRDQWHFLERAIIWLRTQHNEVS